MGLRGLRVAGWIKRTEPGLQERSSQRIRQTREPERKRRRIRGWHFQRSTWCVSFICLFLQDHPALHPEHCRRCAKLGKWQNSAGFEPKESERLVHQSERLGFFPIFWDRHFLWRQKAGLLGLWQVWRSTEFPSKTSAIIAPGREKSAATGSKTTELLK